MAGFNLPPGCSVGDLPGNSARDEFIERFVDVNFGDPELIAAFLVGNDDWIAFLEAKAESAWDRGDR